MLCQFAYGPHGASVVHFVVFQKNVICLSPLWVKWSC